jgi:SAM-dependent methyltransferase
LAAEDQGGTPEDQAQSSEDESPTPGDEARTPEISAAFDRIFQAWDYARIEGLIAAGGAAIESVKLVDADLRPVDGGEGVLTDHEPDSPYRRLTISCLTAQSANMADHLLEVRVFGFAAASHVALAGHVAASSDPYEVAIFGRFRELIADHPAPRVLEVGGRDRSGVSHRHRVGPVAEYVGVDVLPGPGVDFVADAHTMSDVLGRDRFDFACSYFVWEHLAFPWKAVIELNRVLVAGGYAFVVAPQTSGLHDMPWDYFRFSDSAFRALFAPETGFEVIDVVRGYPMHVFPFMSRRGTTEDERAAGFFSVAALVHKVAETTLEWPVDPARIAESPYPE